MTATITIEKISATKVRVTITADIEISSNPDTRGRRATASAETGPAEAGSAGSSGQEMLTVEQAAELLHIGRDKVYYLIRSRQLRSIKIGKLRRISRDWIAEYVRQHEQGSSPDADTE
jgi:excisionase family DNA binding protein